MERIIVATDFSPAANNAVHYAAELARYFSASLVLVNAYPFPPANYEMGFSVPLVSSLKEAAEEQLQSLKEELSRTHNTDLEIDWVAEMGAPYDVLESVTRDEGADLVVMGIVGEAGKIKENLMGSTALNIARGFDIPALIIPENMKYHRIHKISFACDLDKTEQTDLVYIAKYFSKLFDAELEIINVERPAEETSMEKARTSVFMEKKLESVNHKTVYITGNNPGHELEEYFTTHPTDMIMLNPKKHNLFWHLFNQSVTKELIFHSHLPILAIH